MKKKITAFIIASLFAITSSSLCFAESDIGSGAPMGPVVDTASASSVAEGAADGGGVAAAGAGFTRYELGFLAAAVVGAVAIAVGSSSSSSGSTTTVQH